ncbi:MAG: PIN domain-containing protein [Prevotella sp.]|nr:PIN domain-containing protein [Candidatus Prevotella equi]
MKNKLYIDTNVLIDVVTSRNQPHVIYSQRLFAEAYRRKIDLYVSALSFVTTVYVARKYHLSEEQTRRALKIISSFVNVVELSETDALTMLDTEWKDYEDALQYCSALKVDADYIITGNISDFSESSLPVLTPQQYLERFV